MADGLVVAEQTAVVIKRIISPMPKPYILFIVLSLALSCVAQQEKEPGFPTTDEIKLVITQSERVFEQYKQSVTMEGTLPTAKQDPSGVSKDREVYDSAKGLIAALTAHPEGFHGVGGLLLLSLLDDASRNAALCSGTAYDDSYQTLLAKSDISAAKDWLHVGLSCVDVSGYLYTVSESVQALLLRDLKAQQLLNERALESIKQTDAALKKCASQK